MSHVIRRLAESEAWALWFWGETRATLLMIFAQDANNALDQALFRHRLVCSVLRF